MRKREYPLVTINKKQEKSVNNGHPWIYSDEVISIDDSYTNGDIVDVVNEKGKYLGSGFINDHSKIMVRLFSKNTSDTYDDAFWARRIQYAIDYRLQVMDDLNNARLVFGEADQLPGLTIDKFNDVLVAQVMCLGTDLRKETLFNTAINYLNEKGYPVVGLYERNDVALRDKEGLSQYCAWYNPNNLPTPDIKETIINENDVLYHVDFINGQKTGFFLDQKYNRKALGSICKNLTVLDCFTHTGSFGLNALKGGAKHVTFVDISKDAIEMTKRNVELNGFMDKADFVVADVFAYLQELKDSKQHPFDCIILDPPAFTKSRSTIHNAMKGYKTINTLGLQILKKGGYFATASCSHFAYGNLFDQMISNSCQSANVTLREIEKRKQSKDHPILPNVSETEYLKFHLYQKI